MKKYKDSALKRLRCSRHLSQKNVAEKLGVSLYRYRRWEQDLAAASFHDAVLLSRYFGVPLRTLFFYE
ncbi:MAG: helix-turn-helix transcriptional regulator [Clostridia bacterium]